MEQEFRDALAGAFIQWDRNMDHMGIKQGKVQQIDHIRVWEADGNEYIFFKDGTKTLSILLNDAFFVIDPNAPIHAIPPEDGSVAPAPEQLPMMTVPQATLVPASQVPPPATQSPLAQLLDKQKRTLRTIKMTLEVEVPDPASMKIIRDSFEEGFDDEFEMWLKKDDKVLTTVMQELKNKLIKQ